MPPGAGNDTSQAPCDGIKKRKTKMHYTQEDDPRKLIPSIILIALCIVTLVWSTPTQAQSSKYKTASDILYREGDKLTPYMRQRCRLDVYYPTDVKNFPTVVWFHGGGLSAGNRSVPKLLKEQKIAIVAVNYRLHPKVKSPAYVEDAAAAVA